MKRFLLLLCLCTVVIFSSCEPKKTTEKESIVFWYGKKQTFGALGHPQKQINILGRIYNSEEKSTAFYSLNGGPLMLLTLGSDLHRLANRGDFNVELYRDTLQLKNRIVVYHYKEGIAVDSASTEITFHKDRTWPLPYSISWKSTDTLTKAVQVVDGLWQFDEDGLSNDTIYYDRVVCFGDSTWTDYEVRTTVTFHDFTPPRRGAPVYNVSHAAIATRWPGHDADSLQPNRKWHPLGATAEFRLTKDLDSCRWRIFDGEGFYVEAPIKDYRNIALERPYHMLHQVLSLDSLRTKYAVKLWEANSQEPDTFDLVAIKPIEHHFKGSACLLAHNTSVTFGDVTVTPVTNKK